jgi:hypothetical protein
MWPIQNVALRIVKNLVNMQSVMLLRTPHNAISPVGIYTALQRCGLDSLVPA